MNETQFEAFKAKMNAEHAGAANAYKTLYLAPGADVQVVGKDFQQMDFANTQGRDETRIASAAGVPPVIVGLKESLQGSSLNQGNFGAARRSLADITMRPLYRSSAAALETLVPAPQDKGASKLWFDDSQVAFFREDRADGAKIQMTEAQTMKAYLDGGFTPESSIAAMQANDTSLLVHSGLYSVQLQAPGSGVVAAPPKRATEQLEATRSVGADGEVNVNLTVPITNVMPEPVREQQAPPVVHVHNEVQPAPVTVNVDPTPVNVAVAPTPVTVRNEVEVQPAPVTVLPSEPKSRRVIRDNKGDIVKVVEE